MMDLGRKSLVLRSFLDTEESFDLRESLMVESKRLIHCLS